MSVYVHRYIEINRKILEGRVDFSNISKDLKPGCYYSGWEKGYHKYIKVISNENHNPVYEEVNEKDVPCRWELVKWYSDIRYGYSYEDDKSGIYKDDETKEELKLKKHVMFADNGGVIRDTFLNDTWGNDYGFANRGYPDDISDELRKELGDGEYTWGHTSVLLSEWQGARDKLVEKFRASLVESINHTNFKDLNDKLDFIMKLQKNPSLELPKRKRKKKDDEDEGYVPSLDYLFEEDFWDILCVQHEINSVYHIVDEIYGYTDTSKIRIVYFCG